MDANKPVILITRDSALVGGDDRITLNELLSDAGYHGNFSIDLCLTTDDDYLPVTHLMDVKTW